jgi:hypothetical protein
MLEYDQSISQDEGLSDYFHSDYMTEQEMNSEAEVPVPDRLLSRSRYQELLGKLKLSQRIGILVWLNRNELLSLGGRERLLYLQAKASFEALEASLKFAQRLSKEKKLITDFKHQIRELNRRPQSKHFRQSEVRRLGVGYRDKGTLPGHSASARAATVSESFISSGLIPEVMVDLLRKVVPHCLTEDGEWIDLSMISEDLRILDFLEAS